MYYPFGYEHYLEQREKQGKHESIAAQIKAEDQALIAGMRGVPRAERHSLREIPTEKAHLDWKERLAKEAMENAAQNVENIAWQMENLWISMTESEGFWLRESAKTLKYGQQAKKEKLEEYENLQKEYECMRQQYDEASQIWTRRCLEWDEICACPEKV